MNEAKQIDLAQVAIDPSCAMEVSAQFAIERQVLPLCVVDDDLIVAMANPSDVRTQAEIRRELGMPVVPLGADPAELERLLRKVYGGIQAALTDAQGNDATSKVDYLLRMAFMRHASDIHFDPDENGVRVRFRIDGDLTDVMRIPPALQPPVISRLKVMGDLKLDERRAPQDGAFSWRVPDGMADGQVSLDVRMATLPGHYGEKVTLRLLETDSRRFMMDTVGLLDEDRSVFEHVLGLPHGMVLLTGPTGSGKTTTLYAAIQHLLTLRPLNIVTVENPVEYEIPGIFQAEVDVADKVNFSKALRSILRHDPDVIMIGEIRDQESMDTAVKSALTGHLVLSTLHTNDSINAVTRLANMGLERHLIAATLRLAVAQRLVRGLCPHCRTPYVAGLEDASCLGVEELAGHTLYKPGGCVYCAGRGLRGRLGLFELFRPDVDISSAIADGMGEHELRRMNHEHGGRTLLEDGVAKCLSGQTTVREVSRVAYCY